MLALESNDKQENGEEWVIPVDAKTEEKRIVKHMYCKKCKSRGSLDILASSTIIEEGYEFDMAVVYCYECGNKFQVKFFNTQAPYNRRRKEYADYIRRLKTYFAMIFNNDNA